MATLHQLSTAHTHLLMAQLAASLAVADLGYQQDEAAVAIDAALAHIHEAFMSVSTRLHAALPPKADEVGV